MKKEENIFKVFLKIFKKTNKEKKWDLSDKIFWTVLSLMLLGSLFMYGSSLSFSEKIYNDKSYIYIKHLKHIFIGILLIIFISKISISFFFSLSYVIFAGIIALLILVLIPEIGLKIKGSQRWINLFFFNLQPSEWAKVFIYFFISRFFLKKQKYFDESFYKGIFPCLFLIHFICFLVFVEYDFSSSVIIFSTLMSTLFILQAPFRYFLYPIAYVPVIYLFIYSSDYMRGRLFTYIQKLFLDGTPSYQELQVHKVIGNSSWFQNHLGEGSYYARIPEAHTDFYFINIIADLGLLGGIFVLLLYLYLFFLLMKAAYKVRDSIHSLFIYGVSFNFIWQSIFNLCSSLGIFPITGTPLPFLSYGGNSMIVSSLGIAFILRILIENKSTKNKLSF